ncbi:hypothetical protein EDD15DRAFT_2297645 [Pisolithus albus]|nr:hypothetical protein EDD15DRAFT_2314798 [Pisolithus albus]KAI5986604.1 hypothetical protein EDD15DRAFT_2297645 [Pisolithus albus]
MASCLLWTTSALLRKCTRCDSSRLKCFSFTTVIHSDLICLLRCLQGRRTSVNKVTFVTSYSMRAWTRATTQTRVLTAYSLLTCVRTSLA